MVKTVNYLPPQHLYVPFILFQCVIGAGAMAGIRSTEFSSNLSEPRNRTDTGDALTRGDVEQQLGIKFRPCAR